MKLFFFGVFFLFSIFFVEQSIDGSIESKPVFLTLPTQPVARAGKVIKKSPKQIKKKLQLSSSIVENSIDYSDVENLEFDENIIPQPHQTITDHAPSFIEVAKNGSIKAVQVKGAAATKIKSQTKEVKIIKSKQTYFELSYNKLEVKAYRHASDLSHVELATLALDLSKYDDKPLVAKIKNEQNKLPKPNLDRISTELSAPERTREIDDNIAKETLPSEDELVFFDYSEVKSVAKKEVESSQAEVLTAKEKSIAVKHQPLIASAALGSVQARPSSPTKMAKESKTSRALEKLGRLVQPTKPRTSAKIAEANKAKPKPESNDLESGFNLASAKADACSKVEYSKVEYSYDYSIGFRSVGVLSAQKEIRQFEMRFMDDIDDIERDFGEGRIRLTGLLKGDVNIRRATLLARGHFPTATDLMLEDAEVELFIPAFSNEKMEDLAQELGISDSGAHLLIELDESTENIELGLDHQYKAKIYLDKNFKPVERGSSDYFYIMFLGIEPGNTIVNFLDSQNKSSSKIIHLASQEVYYEPNFYAKFNAQGLSFYQEGLMTDCHAMLPLSAKDVAPWSYSEKVLKESLNQLSLKNSIYPLGSKKYLQLNHLEEPIFLGFWGQKKLVVPTENYINQVIQNFNIRGGECVVQLNLVETPLSIKYNGVSNNGGMNTTLKALDLDGLFYDEPSDQTKKLFFKGEQQGVINIKLNYPNNSSKFIQTFCSENTYLVEQL